MMEHPREECYRIWQQFQKLFIDRIHSKRNPDIPEMKYRGIHSIKYSAAGLNAILPDIDDLNIYKIFNYEITDLFNLNEWRKDLKNNITSPIKFASFIHHQQFNDVGESKYVFELSRLHHLPLLCAKAVIDQGDIIDYYAVVKSHIIDWISQNPYLKSINWVSGIEVAIRATNLIFCRELLSRFEPGQADLLDKIDKLLYLHACFLINHLSLYSSANNHLITELMGIINICGVYRFRNSEKWFQNAFTRLLKEMERQVYKDGFNKEQSTRYHASTINSFITASLFARNNDVKIQKKYYDQIFNMIKFLNHLMNDKGVIIDIGDSDCSELIYPYADNKYKLYGSLMTDGFLLSGDKDFLAKYTRFDFRNYLLFGDKGLDKFRQAKSSGAQKLPHLQSQFYKDSGYYVFSRNKNKLIFDVGSIGYGNLAAHGHSDLLHFTFEVDNFQYIIDSGTYQYSNKYQKWRNYFKGVKAHNTISVNQLDQAFSCGKMIWAKKPVVFDLNIDETETQITCSAAHNGFKKQGVNVLHRRSVKCLKEKDLYKIIDKLECKGEYEFSFYLHFNPTLQTVKLQGDKLILINKKDKFVVLRNPYFGQAVLYKGDEQIPMGWYSPSYDVLIPTWGLKLDVKCRGTKIFETLIDYSNVM